MEGQQEGRGLRQRYLAVPAWVWIVTLVVLVFVVAGVATEYYWRGQLRRRMATVRAAGMATSWSELYESSTDGIPVVVLGCAGALAQSPPEVLAPFGQFAEFEPGRRLSPELLRLMAADMAVTENAVAPLLEPNPTAGPVRRIHSSAAPVQNTNHLLHARQLARHLGRRAMYAAHGADADAAFRALRGLLRLPACYESQPASLDVLIGAAIGSIGVSAVEDVLEQTELPPDILDRLQDEVNAMGRPDAVRMAECEIVYGLDAVSAVGHRQVTPSGLAFPEGLAIVHAVVPGYTERVRVMVIDSVLSGARPMERDDRAYVRQYRDEELGDRSADLPSDKPRPFPAPHTFWKTCCVSLAQGTAGMRSATIRAVVRRRVAATALAAERFRTDRGRWPESLEELVPDFFDAVPQDTMAPAGTLRMLRTETGLTVYSVGLDGQDDGGDSTYHSVRPLGPKDIVFSLLDPEHRGTAAAGLMEELESIVRGGPLDPGWGGDLSAVGFTREVLNAAGVPEATLDEWGLPPADTEVADE